MKSFVLAAAIALVGSSMIADDAAARGKRGAGAAGMAGMAAMAPLALSAGAALIGSGGYIADPVVTPYVHVPTYVEPVMVPDVHVPHVHVPVHTPVYVPTPFGLPGVSTENYGG
jgi:hypothetical protein